MKAPLEILDLGHVAYLDALAIQEARVEKRKTGAVPDALILVEHEPVYTLGRNAKNENVLASPNDLDRAGIHVIHTGRGGDVTYHGPGQLVGYPILDLGARGHGVVQYVTRIEETLIRVLAGYGLTGARDPANRGVWIGNEKIAAIGVRVTRQITMHGFALNVRVNLEHYRGIVPCGLPDKGVTSLDRFAPGVEMPEVKARTVRAFKDVFGYD